MLLLHQMGRLIMTSPQDNSSPSNWRPYPAKSEWLSEVRLILPVANGFYGMPGNQVVFTSNHKSSLDHFANVDHMTTLALDGGGFPVEVASAFGLLTSPPNKAFQEYVEYVGGSVTFYIPPCLSVAWGWKDGEERLGGLIRVDPSIFPNSKIQNLSPILIRLYAAVRLALAQLLLLLLPIAIINIQAFIPTTAFLLVGAILMALLWNFLPASGWVKGGSIGIINAVLAFAPGFLQTFSLPPLFLVGVVLLTLWLGGQLMGARSSL